MVDTGIGGGHERRSCHCGAGIEGGINQAAFDPVLHSTDPDFEEKMLTIVGLYLNPPENAIVLSVDEKTGIQALDRTQPVLPLKPHGKIKNIPFEYKQLGTTSLIAALEVHKGNVTGVCEDRHTHVEFLSFLQNLVRKFRRKNREIHIIMDNYSAHKHYKIKEWVAENPDVYVHFTTAQNQDNSFKNDIQLKRNKIIMSYWELI